MRAVREGADSPVAAFWGEAEVSLRHGVWVEDLVGVFPLF